MPISTASQYFANYSKIRPRLPFAAWMLLRLLTLVGTFGLATVLLMEPRFGLRLFWGLAIPLLPAIFVIAPGLWRQVCPMALMNQLPRMTNLSLARDLPKWAREWAFSIAVACFVAIVGLRASLLNSHGFYVGLGVLAVLSAALAGGLVYKGRSGWCGTFCPLGPIQRDYGHAPLLMVRNGYCSTCVGCQKNCYDFNPRAAVFGDLYDDDPGYAGQRRFFMAMMPGMVLGYFFWQTDSPDSELLHVLIFAAAIATSVGLYQAIISFSALNPFRTANLFACAALAAFYFFAGPAILDTVQFLSGVALPPFVIGLSRWTGIMLAAALLFRGWKNEAIFRQGSESAGQVSVAQGSRSLSDRLAAATVAAVTDKGTGTIFPVARNQSLLEAMEAARVNINFGCRAGLCGADAVIVCDGQDNLSPPGEDELATLRRLGLQGIGRLACMCRVQGEVTIDRDIEAGRRSRPAEAARAEAKVDALLPIGIGKVVIIGNGVAGITVAEALRNTSESVDITVVTDEPHHFYNRMAIGRVLYGRTAMDGLFLLPDTWYADNRIDVWRNTVAVSIDRDARVLRLGTGETLPYDRLVLATGADAMPPSPDYARYSNTFVLRSAADAQAVRLWVQQNAAHKAVVIGGGVLGVEAADALHHLGMQVTLLQRSGRLMDRQLDANGAQRLTQYLRNIDVMTRTEAVVSEFQGEGRLDALILRDGTRIEGDVFIACAGVAARTGLAKQCGLEVGRGIKVDGFMRTSDPAIYAVGDAAELSGASGGLWPVARAHAAAAISGMLERTEAYAPPRLLVQLKCDGIDLKSFGDLEPRGDDETICASEDAPAWWRLVLRDGNLVGAVFVGPPGSGRELGRVIQAGTDLRPVLAELREGRIEALQTLA